jgi:aminopeptidase C
LIAGENKNSIVTSNPIRACGLAVGYDDAEKRFIVRHSWSTKWGMKGYFTMPYAYLADRKLSDDFWTIRRGERKQA